MFTSILQQQAGGANASPVFVWGTIWTDQEGLQQGVLTNLSARFHQVPDEAREIIQKVSQIETLENLVRHSATAESLEQFMQILRKVVASESNTENPSPQP